MKPRSDLRQAKPETHSAQRKPEGAGDSSLAARFAFVAGYCCAFRNVATSRADGIEGCAPLRVTEIAATAAAYRAASSGFLPDSKLTAKPALNASPAAVESMAFTLNAGAICRVPSAVAR